MVARLLGARGAYIVRGQDNVRDCLGSGLCPMEIITREMSHDILIHFVYGSLRSARARSESEAQSFT